MTLLLLSTSFTTRPREYYADAPPRPHRDEGANYDRSGGGEWDGRAENETTMAKEADGAETTEGGDVAAQRGGHCEREDGDHPNRPKRRPRGEKWRGWDGHADSGARPPENEWWRNSENCFAVDDVCHRRMDNAWFYHAGRRDDGTPFQPYMELKCAPAKYDGGANSGDRRISIKLSPPSKLDGNLTGGCKFSHSRVHVVVQSLFNDMIGEFYSRSLLGLYGTITEGANRTNGGALPWEEDVQFYAHIAYGNKVMLDGHKLLLSGMLSNPDSPPPKSFGDLFMSTAEEGRDADDCECYEKMVFCGYDVYTHDNDVLSKDIMEPAVDLDDGNDVDAPVDRSLVYDRTTKFTLWSSGSIDGGADVANCVRSGILDDEYGCLEWNGLRRHMGDNFFRHYPTLAGDIAEKRREYLLNMNLIERDYSGNASEFTLVGLTQRTYRRSWINLPEILEKCNAAAFERVICVEVNVEETSSPFEQLILHRSLDVIIGVHGAQLTQAVLLPPNAHVLELLPWIPEYIRKADNVNIEFRYHNCSFKISS